jgi:hypothetical protein
MYLFDFILKLLVNNLLIKLKKTKI